MSHFVTNHSLGDRDGTLEKPGSPLAGLPPNPQKWSLALWRGIMVNQDWIEWKDFEKKEKIKDFQFFDYLKEGLQSYDKYEKTPIYR